MHRNIDWYSIQIVSDNDDLLEMVGEDPSGSQTSNSATRHPQWLDS